MKINLLYRLKVAALIGVCAVSQYVKAEPPIITEDFKVKPWGYSLTWDNHFGSYAGAKVMFIKLKRSVQQMDNRTVSVTLSYPDIPKSEFSDHQNPQYGTSINCSLNENHLNLPVQSIEVKRIASNFAHPNQETDYGAVEEYMGKNSDARLCVVSIQFQNAVTANDLKQVNWNKAVYSGLEGLRIVQREFVTKSFAPIAESYISFLKEDNVSFKTDDEFWFLASASLHKEPTLAKQFKKSSSDFVRAWLEKLAVYIVRHVGNSDYEDAVKKYLRGNVEYKQNYEIEVDSDEVIYEI